MKRFMQLSIGVLCLMLAVVAGYHLGSQTAQAQVQAPIIGFATEDSFGGHTLITESGDVYSRRYDSIHIGVYWLPVYNSDSPEFSLHYVGNIWSGAPVPTSNESWGTIKSKSK